MGAVPKNKITRAERGKRRQGNRPTLKRDPNAAVPLHKRGLFAQMMRRMGLSTPPRANADQQSAANQ